MRAGPGGAWAAHIAAAVLTAIAAGPAAADPQPLRIGLVRYHRAVGQVTVLGSSDFVVTDPAGGRLASSSNLEPITLSAGEAAITLKRANGASARVPTTVVVQTTEPSAVISVDSPGRVFRKYLGKLEISLESGSLRLVNVIAPEDYLLSVVPAEMPSGFPEEALKAQAVAARTYAAANRGKHSSLGYDLCDTRFCQVYDGHLAEHPACSRAVADTAGIVLTYDGHPADALYCGDCGGATRCYAESNPGKNIPYLCGVKEPPGLAHACWEQTSSITEIGDRLAKAGVKPPAGLREIRVSTTDSSGRALAVDLVGESDAFSIAADRFRAALAPDLRSTMFVIERAPDGLVTFRGRGSGHGYGMCQTGAKGLALPPFNYTFDRILAHYYPGATLSGS